MCLELGSCYTLQGIYKLQQRGSFPVLAGYAQVALFPTPSASATATLIGSLTPFYSPSFTGYLAVTVLPHCTLLKRFCYSARTISKNCSRWFFCQLCTKFVFWSTPLTGPRRAGTGQWIELFPLFSLSLSLFPVLFCLCLCCVFMQAEHKVYRARASIKLFFFIVSLSCIALRA